MRIRKLYKAPFFELVSTGKRTDGFFRAHKTAPPPGRDAVFSLYRFNHYENRVRFAKGPHLKYFERRSKQIVF